MTTKEVASYSPPVGCCAPDRRPLPVGRDVWRGWLVHQVESFELTAPSTLPVGDVETFDLDRQSVDWSD